MNARPLLLRLLTAALPLMLLGCAVGGEIGSDGQRLLPPMPGVDPGEAARLIEAGAPRIQIVLVDRGDAALLVRSGARAGVSRWRTVDNTQIFTRAGMIIGTRGLSFDLMSADAGGGADAIRTLRPARFTRFHTYLDGDDRTRIRSYVCDIAPGGQDQVLIPDGPALSGTLVRENCYSPEEEFENMHLVRNGEILMTRQFINRNLGSIQVLFLP